MTHNTSIHEYVDYVSKHPEAKASREVVCSAWSGEGPSFAVNWTPVGKVYVYDDYLVSLQLPTQSRAISLTR